MSQIVLGKTIQPRFIYKLIFIFNHKSKINLIIRQNSSDNLFYHKDIEAAVNTQIKHEHKAAMNYLTMAVDFLHPNASYTGAGRYFMKMYKEELEHMEALIMYQLTRGVTPTINFVKQSDAPVKEKLTLVSAFTQALEMEKAITEELQNIISTAGTMKDYHCADYITSKFLDEQIQTIHELSHHVAILNKLCDSEQAIWLYDNELKKTSSK